MKKTENLLIEIKNVLEEIEGRFIPFSRVIEAKKSGSLSELNEASLGRAYQHYLKSGEKSWAILTAFRAGNTKKKNLSFMKKLKNDIRSMGLGFFKMRGRWQECQIDVPYDECPPEYLVWAYENSYWINGIDINQVQRLLKKYNQDSAIYAGSDTNGKVMLVQRDGKMENLGTFRPGKISDVYSQVKGNTFTFEWVAQTGSEVMIERRFYGSGHSKGDEK